MSTSTFGFGVGSQKQFLGFCERCKKQSKKCLPVWNYMDNNGAFLLYECAKCFMKGS